MSFGSLLGPLDSLLGGPKSEKTLNVPRENHFFENVAFLVFEALVRKWAPKWSLGVKIRTKLGSGGA